MHINTQLIGFHWWEAARSLPRSPRHFEQEAWSNTSPCYKFFLASPEDTELDRTAEETLHFPGALDLT